MPRKSVDLTGRVCGKLTIVRRSKKSYATAWLCKCSCGKETTVVTASLIHGYTKSCGCLQKARVRETSITHGQSHGSEGKPTAEYQAWSCMRTRCNNPNNRGYKDYGGRGISVCARWGKFEAFLSDMGPRPKGASLDRINNNGNYGPKNCRWATSIEQCNNKRNTNFLTARGVTFSCREWCRRIGMNHNTLNTRLSRGWAIEKALYTPLQNEL